MDWGKYRYGDGVGEGEGDVLDFRESSCCVAVFIWEIQLVFVLKKSKRYR